MPADGRDHFISNKSLKAFSGFIFGFHGQAVKYVFWDEIIFPQLVGETNATASPFLFSGNMKAGGSAGR